MTVELIIRPDGRVRYVYTEELPADLFGEAPREIRRASHVEPTPDGQWTADMKPIGGPVLGPFLLRSEALEAETEFLSRWLTWTAHAPMRRSS